MPNLSETGDRIASPGVPGPRGTGADHGVVDYDTRAIGVVFSDDIASRLGRYRPESTML